MRLELNMEFHLGQRIKPKETVLGFVLICILLIGCTSIDMEQLSSKQFMGFEEEQHYLYSWINKNVKAMNFLDPMLGSGAFHEEIAIEKARKIEKGIQPIIDDAEFYALYIESNVDNGIWNVFLIAHDGSDWVQICWELEQKIILEKPMLRDNWNKKICNFRFSDDIVMDLGKITILDATSVYLFITCHDRLKRFVVYNPKTTVHGNSDDRYILQIQRMIRHIRRNYLWIQLFQRKRGA